MKLTDLIFDQSVYPRKRHEPGRVQLYAECMEAIEAAGQFMSIAADMRLLDGRHRHLAYLTLYPDMPDQEVRVYVHPLTATEDIFDKAVELNSQHGLQVSEDDKRAAAIKMYARPEKAHTQAEIAKLLSVATAKVSQWLSAIIDEERRQREDTMLSMWLSCHSQEAIGEAVGISRPAVTEFLQKMSEKYSENDSDNFRNFAPELYSIWNFPKLTSDSRVFGSIPPEIIDNLLYYYTKPFDVVFDPFGGGGSTIDKCIERKRRYYVSDLNPIPARSDIRKHDITTGLPGELPVPDFVFLDPPYWKQAEGKYSQDPTDLGNLKTVEEFIEAIGRIAQQAKRKWNKSHTGKLALIIGPCKQDEGYIDLAFLAYTRLVKYLNPIHRIIVPYSTQVHGGAYVESAKKNKELLYLYRDLMIFGV